MVKDSGYCGFMTPYVWLYLNSYIELRNYLLNNVYIQTLVQLESSAFADAAVAICTFVLRKENINYSGIYLNLNDFR